MPAVKEPTITLATLAERMAARNMEAYVASHHVCLTCGGVTDTASAALVCVTKGSAAPDGAYHHTRTTAQTDRKLRNAGYIATGMGAEEARKLFG